MSISVKLVKVILLFFFILENSIAQNQQVIDSLSSALDSGIPQKQKVDALNDLAWEHFYTDSSAFNDYIEQAIQLAEEIDYPEGKVDATHITARSYLLRGFFDEAKAHYEKTIQLAQDIDYQAGEAYGINGLGHLKMYHGAYDSAFHYYEQATAIMEEGSHPPTLGLCYQHLARAYLSKGDYATSIRYYDRALQLVDESEKYNSYMGLGAIYYYKGLLAKAQEYQFKALALQEKAGFTKAIAAINSNIANNYSSLGEYEKAKEHHEKAIKIFEANNDREALALAYNNIGGSLLNMNEFDKSKKYLERAIAIYETKSPNEYLPICYRNLGKISFLKGELSNALPYFQKALELGTQIGIKKEIANANLFLGRTYLKLKDYETAERYLKMALEINSLYNQQEGYKALAELEKERGNYQAAFTAFEKFKSAEDSISNEENTKRITRIEMEYEFQQERDSLTYVQEKASLAYEQQLSKRQWFLTGAIALAIFLSITAALAFRSYQIKRKANRELSAVNSDLRDLNVYLKELRKREKELSEVAISAKERELASMSMASHEKNALLKDLEQQLKLIEERVADEIKPTFSQLKKTISNGYSLEDSWDCFLLNFQGVHPHFFDKLKNENPQLSNDDLKLSAYLKIGMSNKEIANVTHLAIGSVKTKVNRLKKKLQMSPEDNLRDYMVRYS